MNLIIGATPYSQWQSITPLLECLGWSNDQPVDAETWLKTTSVPAENAQYLLLHTRPEIAVAQALQEGQQASATLNEWRAVAQGLLAFYKQNRRRAVVVEVVSASQQPTEFINWLNENRPEFAQRVSSIGLKKIPPSGPVELGSNLNSLLATQLVAQTPDLEPILAQLEAASIPLADSVYAPPALDIEALTQILTEKNTDWEKQQETALEQLKQQLEASAEEVKAARAAHKAAHEEGELLLNQLHKVQEELETYYHKANDDEAIEENKRLSQSVADLQAELSNVEKQKTKDEVEYHEKLKDLQEEKVLLQKQFFQIQEELENYYLQVKQKTSHIETLNEKISVKNQKLQNLSRAKKNADEKNKALESQLNSVQKKDETRHDSLTRKAIAPFRAILRPLSKSGRDSRAVKEQINLLKKSELFDAEWYLQKNPDVAEAGADPAEHYVLYGAYEGRNPSPEFNSSSYLKLYPDVAEAGVNPLLHYLQYGKAEGRKA